MDFMILMAFLVGAGMLVLWLVAKFTTEVKE